MNLDRRRTFFLYLFSSFLVKHILTQFRYSVDRRRGNMSTNKGNIPDEGVMGAVNNNNRPLANPANPN